MKRNSFLAVSLAGALVVSACGKHEPSNTTVTVTPPPAAPATTVINPPASDTGAQQRAADAAAANAARQTCNIDCSGTAVSISCPAGQNAVCDCAADPKSRCEPATSMSTTTTTTDTTTTTTPAEAPH